MIISTRESQEVREKMLQLGCFPDQRCFQNLRRRHCEEERPHDSEQFDVSDQRSLDEVVDWLMQLGFIPSSAPPATGKAAPATAL